MDTPSDSAILAALTDHFEHILWVSDTQGRKVHYVSRAYERIYGRTRESCLKSEFGWSEAIHPEDREQALRVAQERNADSSTEMIFRIVRPDGAIRWIKARAFPVRNASGEAVGLAGIAEDVTAARRAEEALAESERRLAHAHRLEAVGRLAGGVAHDFNNLLTAILGYASLLLESFPETDPRREDAVEINRTAQRAAELTRQLLAFSRRQILAPKDVEPNALISGAGRMLRLLLGENIPLELSLRATSSILVDPGQVEQVIVNLAVNARDAMPEGGSLRIETEDLRAKEGEIPGVPAGAYVRIAVIDTGCGMDAETLSRLFEPFFSTKPKDKGTGLGLSTAHGIIAQSGGHIKVFSEPGVGTTFHVYLPRSKTVPPEAPEPEASEAALPDGRTVLLVEDEPGVRTLAGRVLRARGYTVLEAADSAEAAALAKTHRGPIDLLLTDIVMPGAHGTELAAALKRSHPAAAVLFMSGYTEDPAVHKAAADRSAGFLSKPFTPEALASKVSEALAARREGR